VHTQDSITTEGGLTATGDLDAAGGFRRTILFSQADATANQAAVALALHGGDAALVNLPFARAGSIVEIAVWCEGARTAGSLTVDATIGGTVTGLQAILNAANTQVHSAAQAKGTDAFAANALIGVKVTTDASWAAGVTPSIIVGVTVEC
jgi:hypothetical protein